MTVTVGPAADFDTLREEWAALALVHGSIFGTPEWAETWWAEYGRDRPTELLPVTSHGGGLIAIVPLYVQRRGPLRLARFSYRFLHGDEAYKDRFATSDRGSLTLALPRTWLGRLALGGSSVLVRSRFGRRVLVRAVRG